MFILTFIVLAMLCSIAIISMALVGPLIMRYFWGPPHYAYRKRGCISSAERGEIFHDS